MSLDSDNFFLQNDLLTPKIRKPALPWQIATAVLAVLLAVEAGFLVKAKPRTPAAPQYSVPALGRDTEVAAITQKANEFIARYLTFSLSQLEENKKMMIKMMTLEYANAFQIIWQDPTLTAALKDRAADVSVSMDAPSLKEVDKEGRIFVNCSGKVIVTSNSTLVRGQERYFFGTVVLVKTSEGYKVANVVWRNAD